MKDIDEIRRDNLRLIEKRCGGPTETAKALGMSLAQFANLRDGAKDSKTGKPRGMRKETARRIERGVGETAGWLDVDHSSDAPLSTLPDTHPPHLGGDHPSIQRIEAALSVNSGAEKLLHPTTLVPIEGSLQGLDMSRKNSGLKRDEGYWLTVPGEVSEFTKVVTMPDDSMQPEIYPGEYIAFDSSIEADAGDTVLVVDRDNIVWVRKYRPRTEGRFDAVAINPDHATFNSADDNVHVFAVLVGHWRGRRAKRH